MAIKTNAPPPPVPRAMVAVMGMGRSGTSLVTNTLHELGIPILGNTRDLGRGDEFNRYGYWETPALFQLQTRLLGFLGGSWRAVPPMASGWEKQRSLAVFRWHARHLLRQAPPGLAAWKHPSLSLTFPFWRSIHPDWSCIICVRNPIAVYRSLARRSDWSLEEAVRLWATYSRAALLNSRASRRILVFYDDMLSRPADQMDRLATFFGLPPGQARPVVDQALRHYQTSTDELLMRSDVPDGVKDLWRAFDEYRQRGMGAGAEAILDQVAEGLPVVSITGPRLKGRWDRASRYLGLTVDLGIYLVSLYRDWRSGPSLMPPELLIDD